MAIAIQAVKGNFGAHKIDGSSSSLSCKLREAIHSKGGVLVLLGDVLYDYSIIVCVDKSAFAPLHNDHVGDKFLAAEEFLVLRWGNAVVGVTNESWTDLPEELDAQAEDRLLSTITSSLLESPFDTASEAMEYDADSGMQVPMSNDREFQLHNELMPSPKKLRSYLGKHQRRRRGEKSRGPQKPQVTILGSHSGEHNDNEQRKDEVQRSLEDTTAKNNTTMKNKVMIKNTEGLTWPETESYNQIARINNTKTEKDSSTNIK
ncbi:uncharacterized protein BDR25DRAFT_351261 [Lindgomyces ingoldianus]|uniref:Uncharacterized protein n=1 Tax=Lindgomyces ingoldianus TaxID=673940 RepID=A0ACB6R8F8_9PLEO|nr:uncharacterized protein BDR25DRAFT_351261 [Lindgomyces ingoldianus]KAF2474741.1 hypothetical protein BDR25DRAFT_351261 [Lindgomyces ingoldianus]